MKKLSILLVTLLTIGVASAGVLGVSLVFSGASFTPPAPSPLVKQTGLITFDCGGVPANFTLSEPNMDIDDDVEQVLPGVCNKQVTNLQDWTGRPYKENSFGLRSFDEGKLKRDECAKQPEENSFYNSTSDKCETPPEEVVAEL